MMFGADLSLSRTPLRDKIESQMEVANDLLTQVRKFIDPNAILAGGAPRNWYLGQLARDLDIYLTSPLADQGSVGLRGAMERLIPCMDVETRMDGSAEFVHDVFNIQGFVSGKYRGVPVELIFIEMGEDEKITKKVMDHIDTGISKIYATPKPYSSHPSVHTTKEFLKDYRENTLTIYPDGMSDSQIVHCMYNHLPKMLGYFPERQVKIESKSLKDRKYDIRVEANKPSLPF